MKISTPASVAIIVAAVNEFVGSPKKQHFFVDGNSVEVFTPQTCEKCNGACRGPNSIIFTKVPQVSNFVVAGLTASTVVNELWSTDDGEDECDGCR